MANKELYHTFNKNWVKPYTSKLGISGYGSNGGLYISNETVTQTINTDTVVFTSPSGVITTPDLNIAKNTSYTFQVTCPITSAYNESVYLNILNFGQTSGGSGGVILTNGIPYLTVGTISNGSFIITVSNLSPDTGGVSLVGVLKIGFVIVKAIENF